MKRAPRLTGRQLKRVLEKVGFKLVRVEGSHHVMKRDKPYGRVTIPIHGAKIIKLKIYRIIVKEAKLTDDEVRRLL